MSGPAPTPAVDKRKVRIAFSRAAADYDAYAVVQREIGRRMLERLDYVRLAPRRVLDLGCGTGLSTAALLRRYPKAEVLGLDIAMPMLMMTRRRGRWLRRPRCICADLDALPLADQTVDLVFANAALQWSADPTAAFADIARVLRPGGLLMFSSFGPDTLHELRAAWSAVDDLPHVHGFIDMHDYGDMLMGAGLLDPVMDVDRMTLTYADASQLMREVKAIGAGNASPGRARGLSGRRCLVQVGEAYERFRDAQGRLPATYEVVHGHAWAGSQRRQGDVTLVSLDLLKRGR